MVTWCVHTHRHMCVSLAEEANESPVVGAGCIQIQHRSWYQWHGTRSSLTLTCGADMPGTGGRHGVIASNRIICCVPPGQQGSHQCTLSAPATPWPANGLTVRGIISASAGHDRPNDHIHTQLGFQASLVEMNDKALKLMMATFLSSHQLRWCQWFNNHAEILTNTDTPRDYLHTLNDDVGMRKCWFHDYIDYLPFWYIRK